VKKCDSSISRFIEEEARRIAHWMSSSRSLRQLNEARNSTKFRFSCTRAILILGRRKRTVANG